MNKVSTQNRFVFFLTCCTRLTADRDRDMTQPMVEMAQESSVQVRPEFGAILRSRWYLFCVNEGNSWYLLGIRRLSLSLSGDGRANDARNRSSGNRRSTLW
jgi:hypothetical protein